MPQLYNPANITSIAGIEYKVNTTGDAWFQPTIGSDSPDYTADKADAVTQCEKLSPNGSESVA